MSTRQIKFRAWSVYGERMIEWNGMWGITRTDNPAGGVAAHIAHGDQCYLMPEQMRLMQFTGLVDEDGKEIYEGDIVTSDDYPFESEGLKNYVGLIEWDADELCWVLSMYQISDRVCGRACGGMLNGYERLKIIGNICANPELLEIKR